MSKVLISYLIPCGNRLADLEEVMPKVIAAADFSPPVEILVLDYNSKDAIDDYMAGLQNTKLVEGNYIKYVKYDKGGFWHMAHSRNLAIKSAAGEYCTVSATDMYFSEEFFARIREKIAEGYKWIRLDTKEKPGFITVATDELIAAGGYDERFEFYGPEDKELNERLERRGVVYATVDHSMVHTIRTPNAVKVTNYRLHMSKSQMVERMLPIYHENTENKILVANEGLEWGKA